ncbi:MAG TPA: transcription elongation factor GreA [Anaerolineales bacterium]|nr:transcription elongation factor GreA [Anaerolineales bacterium]
MATTFLTREGYDKLQKELDYLRNDKRREVANRLHSAIEESNRLSEDPEYEAAKNEQAFVEGRIRDLELILAQARLIDDDNKKHTVIQVGAKVTIQENGGDPEVYTIVGAAEANPRQGLISNESPLGRALLDHQVGDLVTVNAPSGSFKVKITAIE